MKEYPSSAITRQSGEILDQAAREPVAITRYRKPRFIIMSATHYDKLTRRNPRTVETIDSLSSEMKAEMLDAIDRELADD